MKKLFYTTRLLFGLLILGYTFASDSQFLELKSFKTTDGKEYFSKNGKDNFKQWSEFQKESSALSSDSIRNPTIVTLNGKSLCVAYGLEQETMKECSGSTEVKSTIVKSNNISFSSFMKSNYGLTLSKDFKNVQKYCKTSTLSKKSPISISKCDKRINTYIQESFNNISKGDNISGNQDQLSTIYNTLNSYLNKNKLSTQSGNDEIKKLREDISSIIKNQSKLLISIDQEIAINIASLHIILNDYIVNSNKNNNTITQDSSTNTNNSSTIVNCGSRTALGGSNDTAENCMNKQFKTCSPAIITNLSLDPNQNPFESGEKTYYKSIFEIIGYKDNTCLVKFTSLTSQVSQWNNKSMTCNFDKSKNFIENINSYYLNKCSGELYNIMFSK